MLDSTVSIISEDASLIEAVRGVIGSVSHLRLQVFATIDDVRARLDNGESALLICHLAQGAQVAEVTQLLRAIAATSRPTPLLVLSDEYHADQALALLRLGAVDYLSRPLDLRR